METKNVFVLGLDEANHRLLTEMPQPENRRYHGLLTIEQLQRGKIPVDDLLDEAVATLEAFDGSIDAIVGYWDFPVSMMVPILARRFGTRATSLESVLRCEHKYWSRLEQREVIEEHPNFGVVDPGAQTPPAGLRYPMWLKPVKSFSSALAYKVRDDEQFREALRAIRGGIDRIGEPFEHILRQAELPGEITAVGGQAVLAEEALHGIQAAVEGYVLDGRVVVYGVLDSVDYPGSPSFLRHQYPSVLPESTVRHLTEVTKKTIGRVGLSDATFSVEYFCDPNTDEVALLEINARHSQSHAKLFQHVDGMPNHHAMVALALGEDPALPYRQGEYGMAAKWYHRRFSDGILRSGPTAEEVSRIEQDVPGVSIKVLAREGEPLSALREQDSYSFTLAEITVGARDEDDLIDKYERCVAALRFEFDEAPGADERPDAHVHALDAEEVG